jgi:hypothetical protein
MNKHEVVRQLSASLAANRSTLERWLAYPRQLQQEYGLNPILAGGAVRDLLMGQEVKDLDIFLSPSGWVGKRLGWSPEVASKIAEREGWSLHKRGEEYGQTTPPLLSVWRFKSEFVEQRYDINLLVQDTSSNQLIRQFDFGLNQVAVNTFGILAMSENFVEDVAGNKITIRNDRGRDVILRRYEMLSEKYPVPLVTPEGLEIAKPRQGLLLPGLGG